MEKGLILSAFDFLHAGHAMYIAQAKEQCDYLIAGLHVDPSAERSFKNKPYFSLIERQIMLAQNKNIDKIVVYEKEDDVQFIIDLFNVAVRFVGEDYIGKSFTAMNACRVVYLSRKHGISSSGIRQRLEK